MYVKTEYQEITTCEEHNANFYWLGEAVLHRGVLILALKKERKSKFFIFGGSELQSQAPHRGEVGGNDHRGGRCEGLRGGSELAGQRVNGLKCV